MLSSRRIMEGVIEGVNVGGNCSGIPTPQGFVYFDESYRGKPLVFVGTVGLIPREKDGRKLHEKKEARDRNLYNSKTDDGAGGLSCSVAEMGKESGGCNVNLNKVPLKYPGL